MSNDHQTPRSDMVKRMIAAEFLSGIHAPLRVYVYQSGGKKYVVAESSGPSIASQTDKTNNSRDYQMLSLRVTESSIP